MANQLWEFGNGTFTATAAGVMGTVPCQPYSDLWFKVTATADTVALEASCDGVNFDPVLPYSGTTGTLAAGVNLASGIYLIRGLALHSIRFNKTGSANPATVAFSLRN